MRRAVLAALLVTGCAPSSPTFTPIDDAVAFVGSELVIALHAKDPEGDPLEFGFRTDHPDVCRDGRCRAEIRTYDDGNGVFRWTPRPEDAGVWEFEFQVSDGSTLAVERVTIEVRSSVGYHGAPLFILPLGTGTTLDLTQSGCVDLDVVVNDPDSSGVELVLEPPFLGGAELTADSGFAGTFTWCPSDEQIDADDRYRLTFSASDGKNPKTMKDYLLVLSRPPKAGCAGEAPELLHTPAPVSSIQDIVISVEVEDDVGLKAAPLLYYSTTQPSKPPELAQMIQVEMAPQDGGSLAGGTFAARVPNPVTALPAGTSATLYYVLAARDNDDPAGGCDHLTLEPSGGYHAMTITNPGTGPTADPGLPPCEPCTADAQCGGAADQCVVVGAGAASFCLAACDGGCPAGFTCSASPVVSVDGVGARQCVPVSGTCGAAPPPVVGCADDPAEENDSRAAAAARAPLPPGSYDGLVSCNDGAANDDEDFFRITLAGDAQVEVELAGGDASDLDLKLLDAAGALIAVSDGYESAESVSVCLGAGDYYLRVYAYEAPARNPYTLSWSKTGTSCAAVCAADPREDDDSAAEARWVSLGSPHVSTGNTICAGDDDWYEVDLAAGETLVVDLTFTQEDYDEDLDLHFYDAAGVDLTPCSEDDPSTCSAFQGQSVDSNEYYEHTAEAGGTYYLVVRGWDGAENSYDLRMEVP